VAELLQSCRNRLQWHSLDIGESYRRKNLNVALEVHPDGVDEKHHLFIQGLGDLRGAECMPSDADRLTDQMRIGPSVSAAHRHERFVFVSAVEDVKLPQEWIPSLVWLQRPKKCGELGQPLLYFSLAQLRFKFLFCDLYR